MTSRLHGRLADTKGITKRAGKQMVEVLTPNIARNSLLHVTEGYKHQDRSKNDADGYCLQTVTMDFIIGLLQIAEEFSALLNEICGRLNNYEIGFLACRPSIRGRGSPPVQKS